MSTIPASEVLTRRNDSFFFSPPVAAGLVSVLAALGLFSIYSTVAALRDMWMGDGLKSIGMIIPVVSFILILRVWRSLGWEMQGTWWGMVLLLATIAAVRMREHAILIFVASPQWSVYLPPHSLVFFAYGSAIVLLFGGTRLYRAALFPILLLWLVNPVPHIFNVFVDLPLQHASAHVARSFARALGQPLTADQLRLMFTPEFGMFIAPGCNGIRGAVTMGLIALVAGYLYRFRAAAHGAIVVAAVLLGYLFNFVRLCLLVIYYIVALHFPRLQNHGEMADYYIGGALFLFGTMLLTYTMRRAGRSPGLTRPAEPVSRFARMPRSLIARSGAMLGVALFCAMPFARAMVSPAAPVAADAVATGHFPEHAGTYTLTRSWADTLATGVVLYQWGEYTPNDGGTRIAIGVSPVLGSHDTLICHSARGEDPLWHGQITMATAGPGEIPFSGSFFNDGVTQSLEATTLCNGRSCGEFSSSLPHFGFVYSKPDPAALFGQSPERSIPILIRAESLDTTVAPDVARQQLIQSLRLFVASIDLDAFTLPYRS